MKHGPSIAVRLTLYPLVLILFLLISAYVIFISAGYDIRLEDGQIRTQKTGIIILATRPGEAKVTIDGEEYEKRTSAISFFKLKINRLASGAHNILVERDGYEPWQGEVEVEGGFVSWLDYLILVPLEKKADPYNFAGSIEDTVVSQDQKRILVYALDKKQNIYNIWLVNTDNKEREKLVEGRLVSGETIDLLSLSDNNSRYLYRKTDKNKKVSYVSAEARVGGSSTNITNLFSIRPDNYYFSPHNDDEFYFISQGNLYRINISSKTQSAILATDVVGIYPSGRKLHVIQKTDDNYGLWEVNNSGDLGNIIKAVPSSKSYAVSYIETQKLYLVHNIDDKDLLLYSNGVKNPTLETIAKNVANYSISPDGEKIGLYSDGVYKVYDIKNAKYFDTIRDEDIQIVDWFSDSSNLLYTTTKGLYLINYDGKYKKLLFDVNDPDVSLATDIGHNIFYTNNASGDIDLFSFSL